jgi:hypothetical protein
MVNLHVRAQSGEWIKFAAEVDSGAVVSVFNASDCELLISNQLTYVARMRSDKSPRQLRFGKPGP